MPADLGCVSSRTCCCTCTADVAVLPPIAPIASGTTSSPKPSTNR